TAFPASSADPPVVGQDRLVAFDGSKDTKKPCTLRHLADAYSLHHTLDSPYTPALVPLPPRSLSTGDVTERCAAHPTAPRSRAILTRLGGVRGVSSKVFYPYT